MTLGCIDERTEEVAGAALYERHCASCHGLSGRGDGPLATSLTVAPADLTSLAWRSGGSFDESAVMMFIDGRLLVAQHGPRGMPVWGAVFAQKHVGEPFAVYGATLDVRALADHLRTIQVE
ncbi:MAG: cytochrome c [Deltaproteobacteria bacterium]|nr:cytochrome c [Deltaproteobacteria bacterium]MBW2361445.1 cytochrome c [Deltaproteobacteria bacterium]